MISQISPLQLRSVDGKPTGYCANQLSPPKRRFLDTYDDIMRIENEKISRTLFFEAFDSLSESTHVSESYETGSAVIASIAFRCILCQKSLENTNFVQCPCISGHMFCFKCSSDSINKQRKENEGEFYCPSGKRCSVAVSTITFACNMNLIDPKKGEHSI